jgi:hypothetical protein
VLQGCSSYGTNGPPLPNTRDPPGPNVIFSPSDKNKVPPDEKSRLESCIAVFTVPPVPRISSPSVPKVRVNSSVSSRKPPCGKEAENSQDASHRFWECAELERENKTKTKVRYFMASSVDINRSA